MKGHQIEPHPYTNYAAFGCDSPFCQTVGKPYEDVRLKKWEAEGLNDAQINALLAKEGYAREEAERDAKYRQSFSNKGSIRRKRFLVLRRQDG